MRLPERRCHGSHSLSLSVEWVFVAQDNHASVLVLGGREYSRNKQIQPVGNSHQEIIRLAKQEIRQHSERYRDELSVKYLRPKILAQVGKFLESKRLFVLSPCSRSKKITYHPPDRVDTKLWHEKSATPDRTALVRAKRVRVDDSQAIAALPSTRSPHLHCRSDRCNLQLWRLYCISGTTSLRIQSRPDRTVSRKPLYSVRKYGDALLNAVCTQLLISTIMT